MAMDDAVWSSLRAAIVTVGGGRGFLVEARARRLVVTAAHCLPQLPPAHAASYSAQRTYRKLLGPVGAGAPTIWAECLFVDPIADLAVLCAPDGQMYVAAHDAYTSLVEAGSVLPIGVVTSPCTAWLLTLDGRWELCGVRVDEQSGGRYLTIVGAEDGIVPGTSGSPIVSAEGYALGTVSLRSEETGRARDEQPRQPPLVNDLPGWLLTELNCGRRLG